MFKSGCLLDNNTTKNKLATAEAILFQDVFLFFCDFTPQNELGARHKRLSNDSKHLIKSLLSSTKDNVIWHFCAEF